MMEQRLADVVGNYTNVTRGSLGQQLVGVSVEELKAREDEYRAAEELRATRMLRASVIELIVKHWNEPIDDWAAVFETAEKVIAYVKHGLNEG